MSDSKEETLRKIARGEPVFDVELNQTLTGAWDAAGNLILDCACFGVPETSQMAVFRATVPYDVMGALIDIIKRYEADQQSSASLPVKH